MPTEKPTIYGGAPLSVDDPLAKFHLRQTSRAQSLMRTLFAIVTGFGTVLSLLFGLWLMFGHLFLRPDYTFAVVFGTRQGAFQGTVAEAGAAGQVAATNAINRGTAASEGDKQAAVIDATAEATARQQVLAQTETLVATAELQAKSRCISEILARAQIVEASCIGTGVAGGECAARGEVVRDLLPQCGQLRADQKSSFTKETPNGQ